jgi:hypothetical protein
MFDELFQFDVTQAIEFFKNKNILLDELFCEKYEDEEYEKIQMQWNNGRTVNASIIINGAARSAKLGFLVEEEVSLMVPGNASRCI